MAESLFVRLARESLSVYVASKQVLPVPKPMPDELSGRAGVFVSLKKNGQLRGCIGTFGPTQATLAEEIIRNAISAAVRDPRFTPVTADELSELCISVDVLSELEPADGLSDLDPQQYGVVVRCGVRTGLLLPMLDGVDTAEQQVDIARQKAGIAPDEEVELYRFSVRRYG